LNTRTILAFINSMRFDCKITWENNVKSARTLGAGEGAKESSASRSRRESRESGASNDANSATSVIDAAAEAAVNVMTLLRVKNAWVRRTSLPLNAVWYRSVRLWADGQIWI
jgi:hypothetical protein